VGILAVKVKASVSGEGVGSSAMYSFYMSFPLK